MHVGEQSFFSQWRNRGRSKVAPERVAQQTSTEQKGAQASEIKLTWKQKFKQCFSSVAEPEQDQKLASDAVERKGTRQGPR